MQNEIEKRGSPDSPEDIDAASSEEINRDSEVLRCRGGDGSLRPSNTHMPIPADPEGEAGPPPDRPPRRQRLVMIGDQIRGWTENAWWRPSPTVARRLET